MAIVISGDGISIKILKKVQRFQILREIPWPLLLVGMGFLLKF